MSFLAELSPWLLIGLFGLGVCAFTLSTISGGGGALMQIPVLNVLMYFKYGAGHQPGNVYQSAYPYHYLLETYCLESLLVLCPFGHARRICCGLAFF